jgi:acyl-CoA dehydrogenase
VDRTVIARTVFNADHEALRASVARFLAAEAVPHYADWDAKGAIPATFWSAAAEHGFVGLAEAGDPRFAAVVLEEAMAAGLPAVALALATHDGYAATLLGNRAMGDLPGHRATAASPVYQAAASPVAVVDSGVRAEARPGGWVLNGAAETVVNGVAAAGLLVIAESEAGSPTAPDAQVVFAVTGNATGLHRAAAPALLGLDALDIADVQFDGVNVAAANRVVGSPDPAGSTTATVAAARAAHQLALAVAAMAGARTALSITVEYVKQRKAFGRPIAEFENTQHALAAVRARVTAIGSFVDSCLAAPLNPAESRQGAAAAFCAAEVLGSAVDTGVQLHGGYGYMWEYPIARAYAAARYFRLVVGA